MNRPSLQTLFARALLDPDAPAPAGLIAWNGSDPVRRLAVYRNNVVVSLIEALRAKFPVVAALVGDDFFAALARAYIAQDQPRNPVLAEYGRTFPAFIALFEPAATVPYLADVARLETIRLAAHHAADAPALGPEAFERLGAGDLDALAVRLHPSVGVISSGYAIFSLWAAHNRLRDIGDVDPFVSEDVVVARPHLDVETTCLRAGEAAFFACLARGLPLWQAAASALREAADFDLTHALHVLVSARLATSISTYAGDSA